MTRKQRRLTLIGVAGLVLVAAAGLVLYAISDRIVFFNSPTEVLARAPVPGQRIRLGGLVEQGSVQRAADGNVRFAVTDGGASVKVAYQGLLPDLFREGQGIVTEGTMGTDGLFRADTVLAKHDENYMPREVVDALKAQGRWQEGEGTAGRPATGASTGSANTGATGSGASATGATTGPAAASGASTGGAATGTTPTGAPR